MRERVVDGSVVWRMSIGLTLRSQESGAWPVDRFSAVFGRVPTRSWQKGDVNPKTGGPRTFNFAEWDSPLSGDIGIEIHLEALADLLERGREGLESLVRANDPTVEVGITLFEGGELAFNMSAELMGRFAELKVPIHFDLFG